MHVIGAHAIGLSTIGIHKCLGVVVAYQWCDDMQSLQARYTQRQLPTTRKTEGI